MKKIYISTIAAALLTTSAMAESTTFKDAMSKGTVSGDISVFNTSVSNSGTTADSGYSMSSIGLGYATKSYKGLTGAIAMRTNHMISEKATGDYSNGTDPEVALSTLNISYSTDKATIVAGRQEIDLEWIGDYHEAVVGVLKYVPDTTIIVGHTERKMAVDADAALEKMADIGTKSNGASVIDVKYEGIKGTTINPYFMNSSDLFSAYGVKVTSEVAGVGVTGHYAATSEDVAGVKDGSIMHLEVSKEISGLTLTAGYITNDKDGGNGSLDALGDNISPFEDGGNAYGADADSYYLSVGAEVSAVTLGAFYGSSSYANSTDSEIVLTAGTAIASDLALDLLYSTTSYETSTSDTDKLNLTLTYSF